MRRFLSRLRGRPSPAPDSPAPGDYKTIWNAAAKEDAKESIFTGATDEVFERRGRQDAERLLPLVNRASRVLSIGCGIGRVERYLAPHVGEVWAVDISGEMIHQAGERLGDLKNVYLRELALGEFLSSFEPESFDLVFSFLVLQHMEREDAFRYLEDADRILKPECWLYLQFPNFISPEYTEAFIQGARLDQRSAGRVRTYTEAEIRHLLRISGFSPVDIAIEWGRKNNAEMYVTAKRRASVDLVNPGNP